VTTALLPVIPEKLRIHPLTAALLTTAAFLDLSDEEQIPASLAQPVLERVGLYVQRLPDQAAERLADDLERLAKHAIQASWPPEAREFIEQFMAYCGFVPDDGEENADDEGLDEDDEDVDDEGDDDEGDEASDDAGGDESGGQGTGRGSKR